MGWRCTRNYLRHPFRPPLDICAMMQNTKRGPLDFLMLLIYFFFLTTTTISSLCGYLPIFPSLTDTLPTPPNLFNIAHWDALPINLRISIYTIYNRILRYNKEWQRVMMITTICLNFPPSQPPLTHTKVVVLILKLFTTSILTWPKSWFHWLISCG